MKKYRYLLWDIDGTVLDFKAAEKAAIKSLFAKFGFGQCTDEMVARYSAINDRYWKALEKKEMTKPQILVERFKEFFAEEGIDTDYAVSFNSEYQVALGDTIVFCDNAGELLKDLKGKYVLAAVTNGTKKAQDKKLSESGLDRIFDYIFISEEIGVEKPDAEFFRYVSEVMGIDDPKEALIIGDSLTSDILGGNNASIDTCWYNREGITCDEEVDITYTISNLDDIRRIL